MGHAAPTQQIDVTRLPEPPMAKGLPVVGQALHLAGDPERRLRELYKQYGPIFRMQAAHFHYTVMAGPEANEFVNGPGKDCFTGKRFWGSFVHELNSPNSIVALDGEAHRKVRRALKPALSRKVVEDNIPDVVDIIRRTFANYRPGDEIPFVYAGQKMSSNIVGHLLMETIPTDEELKEFFYYANNLTILLAVLRLPRAVLRLRGPRFRRAKRLANDLAERVVARAVTQPHSRKLFIDTVREAQAKFPELFTEGDVKSSGFLAFFAGIDTMGQTVVFMLWELLRNPEVLARVQTEVDEVFSAADGIPSPEDLNERMPLTRAVFAEALRLHPTGFGIVRNAIRDFTFNGYRVRAGSDILIYTTMCHRMAEYFPDPDKFDIDRFLPPRHEDRQRGVYAPFGRGPHKCPGASWADAQATLMLGTLLYNYQFSLPKGMARAKKLMRTTPTLGHDFRIRLDGHRPH